MPTKLSPDATARKSWREALPIHPAAELLPLMNESELRELADDISKHGMTTPIVLCTALGSSDFNTNKKRRANRGTWRLLDGRNRLDALALWEKPDTDGDGPLLEVTENGLCLYGYEIFGEGEIDENCIVRLYNVTDAEARALALSYNVHRRHLTADQRRELIANVLKAKPEASNRQVAKQVKADDKTVAKVRTELEATAEIPQLKKTVGGDGKSRKTRKSTNTKSSTTSATEVAARLLVEVTAHAVKVDPTKVGQLLNKKLEPELIEKLFEWLRQVRVGIIQSEAAE